ncbi:MAG: corrinoid protein [Desulfitobacteriaceae bacterium]|nr:corrinoid protein [Desulfitobacteriaceae bacterium]MDD4752356.1 corrinoid protein [Desulfitobacteriaceae bacterium]
MAGFEELSKGVIGGNQAKVKELTQRLIDEGAEPLEIINQGLIAGMSIVGARFKNGEMFVPEVLMSAKAMGSGLEIVKPMIADADMPSIGKVLLGTVKGDLHDIGKNLVGMMLESGGFTVINLGIDIAPEQFVAAIKEHNPDILAMSALLTTTMLHMKDTIELLKEEGLNDKVQVIVGGAPISQDFADEVGAAGFAPDAASAVELCKRLLN